MGSSCSKYFEEQRANIYQGCTVISGTMSSEASKKFSQIHPEQCETLTGAISAAVDRRSHQRRSLTSCASVIGSQTTRQSSIFQNGIVRRTIWTFIFRFL